MNSFENLNSDVENLNIQSLKLIAQRDSYIQNKTNLTKELENLDIEIELLKKVKKLFEHLLDALLEHKKQEIQHLITYGLKTVFTDMDLKFNITIEPKYNSISTTFKTEQVGIAEGDVLESFGGGIVNIESFLLRIITLFQTKLAPILILDESFSNLSEEYVENCSMLLNKLCKELNLTIFSITHQKLMLSHADKVYEASSVNNKLEIK